MSERTEKCGCGQVTHLVTIAGVECYDVDVHGSSAAANGKCFNCQVSFVSDQPEVVPDGESSVFARMNPQQLRAEGKNYGLTFLVGTTKVQMVAAILEARARAEADEDPSEGDIGDADPGDEDPGNEDTGEDDGPTDDD